MLEHSKDVAQVTDAGSRPSPDATGTVITSGNTDDLVFKSVALDGLTVEVNDDLAVFKSPRLA